MENFKSILENAFNAGYQHCNGESKVVPDQPDFNQWFEQEGQLLMVNAISESCVGPSYEEIMREASIYVVSKTARVYIDVDIRLAVLHGANFAKRRMTNYDPKNPQAKAPQFSNVMFLRQLIDNVWNDVTESREVPSTFIANKLIMRTISQFQKP